MKGDRYKCQTCGIYFSRFEVHTCKGHTLSILVLPIEVAPEKPAEIAPEVKRPRGRPKGWRKNPQINTEPKRRGRPKKDA